MSTMLLPPPLDCGPHIAAVQWPASPIRPAPQNVASFSKLPSQILRSPSGFSARCFLLFTPPFPGRCPVWPAAACFLNFGTWDGWQQHLVTSASPPPRPLPHTHPTPLLSWPRKHPHAHAPSAFLSSTVAREQNQHGFYSWRLCHLSAGRDPHSLPPSLASQTYIFSCGTRHYCSLHCHLPPLLPSEDGVTIACVPHVG